MKAKNVFFYRSFGGTAWTGAILLMAAGASAQSLFESNYATGVIDEITPGGTVSVFATGMANPYGVAFNSAGDLFVGNSDNNAGESGKISRKLRQTEPNPSLRAVWIYRD